MKPNSRRRVLLALTAIIAGVAVQVFWPRAGDSAERDDAVLSNLVIMLDGVPFEIMDSLWQAGHFRAFLPPATLISPFPSLTDVGFRTIWDEPPGAGYEDRYFDPEANRMVGGVREMLRPASGAQYRQVQMATGGLAEGVAYLSPQPIARADLRNLRKTLRNRAETDTTIAAYILSTDALAHRAGHQPLARFLLQLEAILDSARARYGPDLRISLLSDHGNDLIPTRRIPLERALREAGFRPTDRLQGPGDVVIPRFGLVSSAFLFTRPGIEPELARALEPLPGIDLIFFRTADSLIHIRSRRGHATVEEKNGHFRYTPGTGDPLDLASALAQMQSDGSIDPDGFAHDTTWFHQTAESEYIDALRRIVHGMSGAVKHPANIIVSLEPGYHFGDPAADRIVSLTGTHGSLLTAASRAFFMSSHDSTPPVLRAEEVRAYLPKLP
jgi:hypothetical protein